MFDILFSDCCPNCRKKEWQTLKSGGCGGQGELRACKACKAVYMKDSGGLLPTEERWGRMPYTLDEYLADQKPKKPPFEAFHQGLRGNIED